jgi:hypothetical protein
MNGGDDAEKLDQGKEDAEENDLDVFNHSRVLISDS